MLDGGSRTLNVQLISMLFDEVTGMVENQSNVGSLANSHLMSQRAWELILPSLHNLAGDALEGEVAYIMQKFKQEK